MAKSTWDSPIDAKGVLRQGRGRGAEDSSIDAKRMPLYVGVLLMIAGFIILALSLYSIVMWALSNASAFGLIGGILLAPVGLLLLVLGSIMLFFGSLNRMYGGKRKRILY
jgi:hypothetical protein